ncbi:hypothetical protein Nepgr_024778 [Nepenthes gracilis]|uniref:Uncharacterized protein n=1 Tax=Nepenthes gracilis TaxID=150966 RepID=A0AAD3Y0E4_NEPGR|nr:hypothetical protein Nepgr_024778 [Nepenthes gracilis]
MQPNYSQRTGRYICGQAESTTVIEEILLNLRQQIQSTMIQSREVDGQGSKKPPAQGAVHKPSTPGPTGTAVHPHQCIRSAANKTPSAQ